MEWNNEYPGGKARKGFLHRSLVQESDFNAYGGLLCYGELGG